MRRNLLGRCVASGIRCGQMRSLRAAEVYEVISRASRFGASHEKAWLPVFRLIPCIGKYSSTGQSVERRVRTSCSRADHPYARCSGPFRPYGVNGKTGRIFAAFYGNDSVEVLEVQRGKRVHSIHEGFSKPQMVAYLPDLNRIVVSNEGDGSCKVLDADTYQLIDTVTFSDDADQLRYDAITKRVYVGYGDEAIGMFDATTDKRLEGDLELRAHPESFQLEQKGSRIFVNLASISQIAGHRPQYS